MGRDAEVAQLLWGCRFSSSLIHQFFQPFVIEAEVVADLVLDGIFDRLLEVVPGAVGKGWRSSTIRSRSLSSAST
jgi:hypothetical protein